jgi:arabinogalactan endo-1,4-beta-galactosidase
VILRRSCRLQVEGSRLAKPVTFNFQPAPLLALSLAAVFWSIAAFGSDFIAGADMSHLAFFESRGVIYRENGQPGDALAILKRHGLTCVRLRLFTSSPAQAQSDPYNYVNNLDYTLPLALRVKAAGLQLMLDFHYSDTWADPGHQRKPNTWTNLAFPDLVLQMRVYNSNTIAQFKAAGAMPDWVQVGNEITGGLLWPDGRVGGSYDTPAQWSQLGQLLNAAVKGIQDASGTSMPRIVVHIDRGGDWSGTQWFFDHLQGQQVPFDVIGESYYPFWHGPLASLATCLTNAAQRYQKPVVIAETAFPWNNSVWAGPLVGLPSSPDGQMRFVASLAPLTEHLPGGLASGMVWWGTEYQKVVGVNGAGFDTASFFDAQGNVLPAADAVGQLALPIQLSGSRQDSTLLLSWPLSGAGASPEVATNLLPLVSWQSLTNLPELSPTGFSLRLPIASGPCRFYRLRSE